MEIVVRRLLKSMKNEGKIRRLLGSDYHLSVSYGENDTVKWSLFKNYHDPKVYFSKDNEAIMTSEDHTEEDLLEYAKTHHNIDVHKTMHIVRFTILIMMLILCTINIFLKDTVIRTIILSVDAVLMIELGISHYIFNHNWNVTMRNLNDYMKREITKLDSLLDDNNDDNDDDENEDE